MSESSESDCASPKNREQKKNLVGPWKNKAEFEQVYNWIFNEDSNNETKSKACKKMVIWRMRRSNLTPASVLSTLALLEVQIRDCNTIGNNPPEPNVLKTLYSSAITRFLNYMSSIKQGNEIKTMYTTAQELGLDPFVVDLRHLCAHGQTLPTLDVFRRVSIYCMNWIQDYFWEEQRKVMINVDCSKMRRKITSVFDNRIRELFVVYDLVFLATAKGFKNLSSARKLLETDQFALIKKFANSVEKTELEDVLIAVVKTLAVIVKRQHTVKEISQIYIEAFLLMNFFFEEAANGLYTDKGESSIVKNNQFLFQSIAAHGFIEELFQNLLDVCENISESPSKRKGASFWADQIVIGFLVFQQFKGAYKEERDENPEKKNLDLSTINTQTMSKEVRKIYNKMNIDCDATLIFGDTFRRPWSLYFSRNYLEERMVNVNEYTIEVVKNCLLLADTPFSDKEYSELLTVIDIYATNTKKISAKTRKHAIPDDDKVYTLQYDVLGEMEEDYEMQEVQTNSDHEKKFGIWSAANDGDEWQYCPLGRLPWE